MIINVQDENSLIVVENLTKVFDSRVILNNISLTAEKGKTTVIIGPSGCGKTVLMKHMIALERPTSGHVYYKGQAIDELSAEQTLPLTANRVNLPRSPTY